MRRLVYLTSVACLALATGAVRADDKDLKALVGKALQAIGGEEKVAMYKAATWKGKGTFHGLGTPIPYTGEWLAQYPDKTRAVIESEVDGNKFTFAIVTNGDKGWRKFNADIMEMDKDQLAEQKQERHADYMTSLLPLLKDKDITLESLGNSKIKEQDAVGIKVSKKGFRDVQLYLDKKTHLLLKRENRVKDDMSGQEMNQEIFYSDYKDADGVKRPMKLVIKRDGKDYIEGEVTEMKMLKMADDSAFDKP
jgi:hypothetical protein